jgi:Icc-related predicted phosphoesterase
MKLAAFTDIHGAYERVVKILKKESPDLAIIGGDLTTVGSVREAEQAISSPGNLRRRSSALREIWICPSTTCCSNGSAFRSMARGGCMRE